MIWEAPYDWAALYLFWLNISLNMRGESCDSKCQKQQSSQNAQESFLSQVSVRDQISGINWLKITFSKTLDMNWSLEVTLKCDTTREVLFFFK